VLGSSPLMNNSLIINKNMSNCLMKFCLKGFFVLIILALVSFIEYQYYTDYILTQLHSPLTYFNLSINALIIFMLMWSLIATYLKNPGYVRDYISSSPVATSETTTTYNVYLKGYSSNNQDEESALLAPFMRV
jgi:hypothetical protein